MSRWCKVVGDRFDWFPRPLVMVSRPKGAILFLTREAYDYGVSTGLLEPISRPAGMKVNKKGEVVQCSPT